MNFRIVLNLLLSYSTLYKAKNRIVGGEDARSEKWPWQASLQMGAHGHVCGASVISNRWLISAAHCFLDSDSVRYEEIILLSIKRIIVHPQYDQSISDYDIALLEMETPVLFSELVQPVCLPSTSRVFLYGTVCYVTGWGAIKENSIGVAGEPVRSLPYLIIKQLETWAWRASQHIRGVRIFSSQGHLMSIP
uniref:Uncharacterized protein n=1 Tax=Corvus moneduloides TaxID=1196302 RepID=A0A8C3DTG4_CORMO